MALKLRQRHPPAGEGAPLVEADVKKTVDGHLLSWEGLPAWVQDNEYIRTGFRPVSNSYLECFLSCFYIHNETANIYSHLFAAIRMIALATYYYPWAKEHHPQANIDDWSVFGLYFLGGVTCYLLSTTYHTVSNHSHAVHEFYLKMDFLGILTVTAGCFPPGIWYTFPCAPRETKIFLIAVSYIATPYHIGPPFADSYALSSTSLPIFWLGSV